MKRLMKCSMTIVFMSLALLASTGCEGVTAAQIEGILQNVDSISGDVTVKLKDGSIMTFNLKDVNIETLRKTIGSAALETGNEVTLETDKDNKVKIIKAHNAEVEGTVKSLDNANNTVTIASEDGDNITIEVIESTKIESGDDEKAVFANLRVGQKVEAKFDVETKKALKIEIEDEDSKLEFEGTVTAINKNAKTVTIRAKNGTEATYKVVASTRIELDDGVPTFDGIKTGMKAKAEFNQGSSDLTKLEVDD